MKFTKEEIRMLLVAIEDSIEIYKTEVQYDGSEDAENKIFKLEKLYSKIEKSK